MGLPRTYSDDESARSRAEQHFLGAGGHRMPDRGQLRLDLTADNWRRGRDIKATFQVAKVTRPLMSVSKICDAGFSVKFAKDLVIILDAQDREVLAAWPRHQGNLLGLPRTS